MLNSDPIHFIKILKYDLHPTGQSKYSYLSRSTLQLIDPHSLQPAEFDVGCSIVLHSPLRRAVESLPHGVDHHVFSELSEVKFDLTQLCSEKEFDEAGSKIVRKRFVDAYIKDELAESRHKLMEDTVKILKICLTYDTNNIIVLSHSFRLKLIEAFIATGGNIIKDPELLRNFIQSNQKTYDFGSGYSYSRDAIANGLKSIL